MHELHRHARAFASIATGIVAGFMLSHALVFGAFASWMIESGKAALFADTYSVFRREAGSAGVRLYYLVCALQPLSAVLFAITARTRRGRALLVAAASIAWPAFHALSGFARAEADVFAHPSGATQDRIEMVVRWNVPLHLAYCALLVILFFALKASEEPGAYGPAAERFSEAARPLPRQGP